MSDTKRTDKNVCSTTGIWILECSASFDKLRTVSKVEPLAEPRVCLKADTPDSLRSKLVGRAVVRLPDNDQYEVPWDDGSVAFPVTTFRLIPRSVIKKTKRSLMLLTTTVGSFPKPDYLLKARNLFSQEKLGQEELKQLEMKATQEVIKLQEEIGLDILVHGEMERGDMVTFFAERLEGFIMSGLVRSYGNRYYKKPIVKGKIKRIHPMALEMFQYAQSLTGKPVKGMLTGPYTICDWSFNEYFHTRRDLVLNLAEVVHQEALDLDGAGAKYIQIDEPAISTHPEEIDLALEAMRIVTGGLNAKTISHICYGDFTTIYPKILDLAVDQLDLEFANNDFANLDIFKNPPFTKEIAVGVIDVHSYMIEKKEKVKENIRKALEVFPVKKVYIDPDCGLKTRTPKEAEAKLRVMVSAVKEIKEEMGLE